MNDEKPRLRRSEVSEYMLRKHGIPVALATLAKMATVGGGPAMQHCGRIPLYHVNDLDAWAEERLSKPARSTSERAA
jgi:hypothetical protein